MEFGLLGDLDVRVNGRSVDVGHARQRAVLAALVVDANRTVSVDQLVERVWGRARPQRVRESLYSYLSRLRGRLAASPDAAISRQPGGYQLAVRPAAVDVHRFGALAARARAAGTDAHAFALFDEALAEWRGEALAHLDGLWFDAVRNGLGQSRLAAELDRNDVALRCGGHARVLPELAAGVRAHPLDERLACQLMLALYRCGRQGEALEHYRRTRRALAEALGADPGPELRRLHQRILAADPTLAPDAGPTATASLAKGALTTVPLANASLATAPLATGALTTGLGRADVFAAAAPVPRQLPGPPAAFVGRDRELAALGAALRGPADSVVTAVIQGLAGTGKTWLALRWSHDNLERFPDGQLHVDLRGFDPSREPLPPREAVGAFLAALGATPGSVPEGVDARAALYRSLIAGRRMLVVVDNARDAEQVRPLLPGAAGCAVLVTSRTQLTGLVAAGGAYPLTLGVLSTDEARDLLARRLGGDRVAAEPEAVGELVARCGRLPLALSIVAARAAALPGFPLGELCAEPAGAGNPLDAFAGGDPGTDLRAVLSPSYRALGAGAGRLFRLLGRRPGTGLVAADAAELLDVPPDEAHRALAELVRAHLVTEHRPGRYACHPLLHAYAADLAAIMGTG
ncbi:AfsR/SARP family transcriptional regulator [Nonomuraea roseoviolacea]|uniref:DNA-binding SARP family transcriptional activator n=1 Tax=Nonomuraea roseoviolacea subsp. carminata TaxID=160689 RepID=A0ABT1KC64_9ACTN|nr:AfsR/SARP family transcriptional regulator [Nonomuraea roseoviolacea]MCP2351219.1 DNA-binding SARP family transcriptional activator [Nonomuraea roseoviolacea subsp. carminata]